MAANDRPRLFRWMDAWMGPDGPKPTTRHVLHALASHMDRHGDGCWPGTRLLAKETGRARKTVRRHLDQAKDAGWITWVEEDGEGQAWRRRRYLPTYPPDVGDSGSPTSDRKAGDPDSPTSKAGEVGNPDSPASDRKVGELTGEGGGTEGGKVGDPDSPRVSKRYPRGTHSAGAHPREDSGRSPPHLRVCPFCGRSTNMPDGTCPRCRHLGYQPAIAPEDEDAAFPDPGNVIQIGPNFPTSRQPRSKGWPVSGGPEEVAL